MTDVLLNIGSRGLAASQSAMSVVSHNVSNANTPGYTRQEAVLASAGGPLAGAGIFGRGVDVTGVRRLYDQFLTASVQHAASSSAADTARADGMQALDALFADSEFTLGAAVDTLSASAADLASHPSDIPSRQVFLGAVAQLAERARAFGGQIAALAQEADGRLAQDARSVNTHVQTVRELNAKITAHLSDAQPNDLLDARDAAVQALQGLLAVKVVEQPDGSLTLLGAAGQPLLVGSRAFQLDAAPDPAHPGRLALRLDSDLGGQWLDAADLGGGRLAGTLALRDQDIVAVGAAVGRLAAATATAFNAVHAQGIDARGVAGQALFDIPGPVVRAASTNTGGASVSMAVADPTQWRAAEYELGWDAGTWTLRRLPEGTQIGIGSLPALVDGWTITATPGAQPGDRWLLQPFAQAAAQLQARVLPPGEVATGAVGALQPGNDNRNALALGRAAGGALLDGASLPQAWAGLVADVGHRTQSAQAAQTVSRQLQAEASARQQAGAGVDLDEEAANLLRHQQTYQACARIIQASQALFDSLLAATTR